jgi:hypothetical protein
VIPELNPNPNDDNRKFSFILLRNVCHREYSEEGDWIISLDYSTRISYYHRVEIDTDPSGYPITFYLANLSFSYNGQPGQTLMLSTGILIANNTEVECSFELDKEIMITEERSEIPILIKGFDELIQCLPLEYNKYTYLTYSFILTYRVEDLSLEKSSMKMNYQIIGYTPSPIIFEKFRVWSSRLYRIKILETGLGNVRFHEMKLVFDGIPMDGIRSYVGFWRIVEGVDYLTEVKMTYTRTRTMTFLVGESTIQHLWNDPLSIFFYFTFQSNWSRREEIPDEKIFLILSTGDTIKYFRLNRIRMDDRWNTLV